MSEIPFNRPTVTGQEIENISQAIVRRRLPGDELFSEQCQRWIEQTLHCRKAFLTRTGTAALEMAAILADIRDGDEVIMSSFTYPSTANAFVLRGAKIAFVDIRPDTMNIDEQVIERAITERTKAIVVVHYAGVACEMGRIMACAARHGLLVIEDAAHAFLSAYDGAYCGTIGHIGCFSFHETKNISCGDGGAIMLNDERFIERAEMIRDNGTNRAQFLRGEIDAYSWVDIGSSYTLSEIHAAYLSAQLHRAHAITEDRLGAWRLYGEGLRLLAVRGVIELPRVPRECRPNGHIYFIKTGGREERDALTAFLKQRGISAHHHFLPLHSSRAGVKYGRFVGDERWTTGESERLLRLPLYDGIAFADIDRVIGGVQAFFAA
jgi:dTDP-4-amino-4,6-dideoxygalactose transaminase